MNEATDKAPEDQPADEVVGAPAALRRAPMSAATLRRAGAFVSRDGVHKVAKLTDAETGEEIEFELYVKKHDMGRYLDMATAQNKGRTEADAWAELLATSLFEDKQCKKRIFTTQMARELEPWFGSVLSQLVTEVNQGPTQKKA